MADNSFSGKPSVILKFTGVTEEALPKLRKAVDNINARYQRLFFEAGGEYTSLAPFPRGSKESEEEVVELARMLSSKIIMKPLVVGNRSYGDMIGTYTIEVQVLYFLTAGKFQSVQFIDANRGKELTPFSVMQDIYDAFGIFPNVENRIASWERGDEPPHVK